MLRTFEDWIKWTNTSTQTEWNTWDEWQRRQPPIHFEKSDMFSYFISKHPDFRPMPYNVLMGYGADYFKYCFGDFTQFIVNPNGGVNALEYFSLLLSLYDTCKGVSRRLTGDPAGISLIRQSVDGKSLIPLIEHNFNQYAYDYSMIHAHTVVQYSLSSLIMRLVSHYMSQVCAKGKFPQITFGECRKAHTGCVFGSHADITPPKSQPIDITQKDTNVPESQGSSWPRDYSRCVRCKVCTR